MPQNYRTTNHNPNDPLFFGTLTPRAVGGTIPDLFSSNIGVDISVFCNSGGPYLSEGLYFSGATEAIRVYENVDDKTNNTDKYFTILPNTDHFIPIKDPTNLYLTAPNSTTTITVRGH